MKSVIYMTATNPRIYYSGAIFQLGSKGPDTQLEDMTFQETSYIPHLSSNDKTIVSFIEENIVIRTHIPYVSPIHNKYPKRDYEDEINESFTAPRKCRPYCRCNACHMASRKAMDELDELELMSVCILTMPILIK